MTPTVTDDHDASDSADQQVTVSAPAGTAAGARALVARGHS